MARKPKHDESQVETIAQEALSVPETSIVEEPVPIPKLEIEAAPFYVISAADPLGIHELLALRDCVRVQDRTWAARLSQITRDFELYGERR